MNKSTRSCLSLSFIIAALGFVIVAGLAMAIFVANRLQGIKTKEFEPPNVIITAPSGILELPAGDPASVNATATGQNPIARLELWADGTLVDTHEAVDTKVNKPFYGDFDYTIKEGSQILIVRAVDSAGIVGQSQAIGITGIPKPAAQETAYLVPLEEGKTLEDVAEENNATLEEVQAANPGLAGQAPAAGTMVQVPIKPKGQAQSQQPGQPQGQQPAQPQGQQTGQPQMPPGNPLPLLPNNPVLGLLGNVVPFAGNDFPPAAPSDLKVSFDLCDVFMTWQDNATNEQYYEVWMATPYMKAIAKLQPGPGTGLVWFKVKPPAYEKMVFWIEAVNKYGKKASQMVSVTNHPYCMSNAAKELSSYYKFELFSASANGPYDRLYCYVSEGNNPETRIPNDDNTFINLINGKLLDYPKGKSQFIVKIPQNGVLNLKGECLAWAGNSLTKLGPFNTQLKTSDMSSYSDLLYIKPESGNYDIRFLVKPLSSTAPEDKGLWWTYGYSDPTLPKPYDLQISGSKSTYAPGDTTEWYERNLEWKWDGDQSKIKGFTVLRDGVPVSKQATASARDMKVWITKFCDTRVRWEVAAVSDSGVAISAPLEYDMPKCEHAMIVHINSIDFQMVFDDEEWPESGGVGCIHTAEGYFNFTVNDQWRSFYTGPFYMPFKGCKSYDLVAITKPYENMYPEPTAFRIPWPANEERLWVKIYVRFWDYDVATGNDLLVSFWNPKEGGWTVQEMKKFPQYTKCLEMTRKRISGVDGAGTLHYCLELEEGPGYLPPKK